MFVAVLLCTGRIGAQTTAEEIKQLGYLINDALFFSDKYITPAIDAAVYQSASSWISSPKETKLWDVNFSIHANIFSIPHRDRSFTINNSDFSFLQIENATSATVPTALGNKDQVFLSGYIGNNKVRLESPQGINMQSVVYPYLQGSLGLLYGTELVVKYSPKVNLKTSNYQVYGFGLKHNISRYFKQLSERKIHLAALVAYSKEEVAFNFLDVTTNYGTLGINRLTGLVDTWQGQVSGSKEFGSFEVMGSFIANTSSIKYEVSGKKGTVENLVPLQQILNDRLKTLYRTRTNYIGEAALKYNIGNFNVQTILAFGKFINTNVSLQYMLK